VIRARLRTPHGAGLQPWAERWARWAGLLAGAVLLSLYAVWHERLPNLSDWGDVAFLAFLVIPLMFALVWLALPVRELLGPLRLGLLALAAVVLAIGFSLADLDIPANLAKLFAATLIGWWFLTFFEAAWWVLLISVLIVPVDLISVARGPTREITENQPEVFEALSVAMPIAGEDASAQLGLPDVLFFALFLGAAARFGLRPNATWALMTLSFGATLALAVGLDEPGVAALPLLSLAFVLVNADRLWRSVRRRTESRPYSDDRPS
jgi:hypothetical protein